ncbi:response regulator [Aggregicoccus sp. 17bor-14]|nr:response regulator [Simulacricoccus sp. 17bor-14]MRI90980.1 response regulator [Aggregicoccus sp. 17bor-14]
MEGAGGAGSLAPPGTVLLVEDNPDDVALTLRAFQRAGITHPVVVVEDGVEALEYLFGEGRHQKEGAAHRPLVVLLDLNLPLLDGHEVLRRIRQDPRTRTLPVVILTSSAEDQDVVRSYDSGANSYVRKPVSFLAFVEAARQLGVYWLQLNHPPPPRPSFPSPGSGGSR